MRYNSTVNLYIFSFDFPFIFPSSILNLVFFDCVLLLSRFYKVDDGPTKLCKFCQSVIVYNFEFTSAWVHVTFSIFRL